MNFSFCPSPRSTARRQPHSGGSRWVERQNGRERVPLGAPPVLARGLGSTRSLSALRSARDRQSTNDLHYIEISVCTLPARSRSKFSHAPFQVVHTNRMPNLSLLADKATQTVPFYVPVREDTEPTTCVVLTASAGGPPLTPHYYTDFRYRTSDSAWQIDNIKPYDIPSPTFFSAVTDRFWDWWRDLHANNG